MSKVPTRQQQLDKEGDIEGYCRGSTMMSAIAAVFAVILTTPSISISTRLEEVIQAVFVDTHQFWTMRVLFESTLAFESEDRSRLHTVVVLIILQRSRERSSQVS